MTTLYPTRYGTRLVSIEDLFQEHHVDKMHPEFARRLKCWLVAQGGNVGIGGSWREDGTQPDKPGFAPEGKSFHQYQKFASGLIKFSAVDLVVRNPGKVHRAPKWSEVPVQGSAWAKEYGVHANVSTESWHMQCVEIDGWLGWSQAGSPDPVPNYPIPCKDFSLTEDLEMKLVTPPNRIYDSRKTGKVKKGSVVSVKVPVPGATAVFVNITVTNVEGSGYLTAWAGTTSKPEVSNLNYAVGTTICNTSWVPVSPSGAFTVYTKEACDLIIDLQATS